LTWWKRVWWLLKSSLVYVSFSQSQQPWSHRLSFFPGSIFGTWAVANLQIPSPILYFTSVYSTYNTSIPYPNMTNGTVSVDVV
jgi:hypothetical protein